MSEPDDAEIAALRARLARLESRTTPPPKRSGGCVPFLIFLLVIVAAFLAFGAYLGQTAKTSKPAAVPVSCDQAWAEKMISRVQLIGIIERMDVKSEGVIAIVNGGLFGQLSYSAKEQMAVAIDCRIAGDGSHLKAVHFRRSLYGDDLASFEAIDLLRARESYASAGWTER